MIEVWVYARYTIVARSEPYWNGALRPTPFATRWSGLR